MVWGTKASSRTERRVRAPADTTHAVTRQTDSVGIGEPDSFFTLAYPAELAVAWRERRLQLDWFRAFPKLFDSSDLEHAISQPSAHIGEWFTAIELHRHGLNVLIEKYTLPGQHPRASGRARDILGDAQFDFLRGRQDLAPDLLAFDSESRFFVEVKRGNDRLKERQRALFTELRTLYGTRWFLVNVREAADHRGLTPGDILSIRRLADITRPAIVRVPEVDPRALPVGSVRLIRCHGDAGHEAHRRTEHEKVAVDRWRCRACDATKSRETKAEIVCRIQSLKDEVWAAGLNRRTTDAQRRTDVPEEIRAKRREWRLLSRDHIDLNWVV